MLRWGSDISVKNAKSGRPATWSIDACYFYELNRDWIMPCIYNLIIHNYTWFTYLPIYLSLLEGAEEGCARDGVGRRHWRGGAGAQVRIRWRAER